jgi:hypothetical protein
MLNINAANVYPSALSFTRSFNFQPYGKQPAFQVDIMINMKWPFRKKDYHLADMCEKFHVDEITHEQAVYFSCGDRCSIDTVAG